MKKTIAKKLTPKRRMKMALVSGFLFVIIILIMMKY